MNFGAFKIVMNSGRNCAVLGNAHLSSASFGLQRFMEWFEFLFGWKLCFFGFSGG